MAVLKITVWGEDTAGGLKFSGSCIRLCATSFTKAILVPTVLISDWSPLTCVLNISRLIAAIFILNFNFEQPTPILFRFPPSLPQIKVYICYYVCTIVSHVFLDSDGPFLGP